MNEDLERDNQRYALMMVRLSKRTNVDVSQISQVHQ